MLLLGIYYQSSCHMILYLVHINNYGIGITLAAIYQMVDQRVLYI